MHSAYGITSGVYVGRNTLLPEASPEMLPPFAGSIAGHVAEEAPDSLDNRLDHLLAQHTCRTRLSANARHFTTRLPF